MTELYSPLGVQLEARQFGRDDFADNRASLPTDERPVRVFTLDGQAIEPDFSSPDGTPIFAATGDWFSTVFDSRLYRCPWHKIEIELTDLPPGCSFALSTASSMAANQAPGELVWDVAATGSLPAGQGPNADGRYPFRTDCLVQSQEGQFLLLKVTLTGDRFRTPVLASMRTLYPRASLLQDLPAVYSADEQSRRFLERLLAALDVEFERLDQQRRDLPAMFDPSAVKAGAFMDYLASWLGIVQESDWSAEQKRRLLVAAPGIRGRRGRVDGLRDHLQAFLSALTGIEPEQVRQLGFPLLVEAFRERNFLRLRDGDDNPLPQALPMWSASRTARLRLDEYARIGAADLVGTGDPVRDPFHEYAHRFRVYVPAAWVRDSKQEGQLRRAIEAEKPAHTRYELCLIASRMQVGLQSTVGVDTIVGGLAPGNVLGRDTLLHCARRDGAEIHLM
jgi:phage tail-like protein